MSTRVPRKPGRSAASVGSLTDLSVSRTKTAAQCGLAYRYRYVDRLPDPVEKAAMIFGDVIHQAIDEWYGPEPEAQLHKQRSLLDVVNAQWQRVLPANIYEQVHAARELEDECVAVAEAIRFQRPELKNPVQTKAYLTSAAVLRFNEAAAGLQEAVNKQENIKWPQDEGPLKAWHRAQAMAQEMEDRWKQRPRPLAVERPFRLDFEGFVVQGRIDQLRLDAEVQTGEVSPAIWDVKTGRQPLTQQEAFLQAFLYDEAVRRDPELPDCDEFVFYHARSNRLQRGKVDPERHGKLALQMLSSVARRIVMADFAPNYGMWCRMCSYRELCEAQIGLWQAGTDGMLIATA